jgi:hypothetical protein
MENKTTTELLDLLWKIESKDGPTDKEWEQHTEAYDALIKRTPFKQILGEREYPNDAPTQEEAIADLTEDVKLLKRHKHDPHSGDVMTRI